MTKPPRKRIALRHGSVAMLVGLFLLVSVFHVSAETQTLETTIDGQPAGGLDLVPKEGLVELSLEDAIADALRHNLGLVVERYRRSRSLLGIEQNRGIYDFTFDADFNTRSSTFPSTSRLEDVDAGSIDSDASGATFSLARLVPTGGTATFTFDNSRSETNNQTSVFNPQFATGLSLRFVQPLLRNFGREVTERNLIVARTNSAISRESFESQVASTIQQVSERYWDLVEAREQLKVSEESLALAKQLHEMNRIQVEVGTLAPLEMVQSEAGVASREEEIIRRRAQVQDSEDLLRQLINLDQGQLWEVPIAPATAPEIAYVEIDLADAIKTAIAERPELRSKRLENQNLELDSRLARNQKKPQLNLTTTYGQSGVGGDRLVQPTSTSPPVSVRGGYGDAIDQAISGDAYNWRIDLNFSYSLQNREAKARSAIADLAVEQGVVELRQLEQTILTEVRRAERGVRTAAQSIESAKVASRLQQKNLEAEQKRYENGLSTSFQVLQIQEDLALARSREVSAVTGYRRALTAYHLAIGNLLDATGIELAPEPESY